MAYIKTNEVKEIRKELKAQFPNLKFSVRKQHHSSVTVSIMKGDVDFSDIMRDDEGYAQVNHYHFGNYDAHRELFEKIDQIIKTAPAKAEGGEAWFDESDSMVDYFHTAFYYSINVGQWDKPYQKV